MQIIAKLLNDYDLFLCLGSVPKDRSNERAVRQVERFLFGACSLISHVEAMKRAEESSLYLCSRYYKQILWPENRRISFASEPTFSAYLQIAPSLAAIVDLQNQLLPICRMIFGIDCDLQSSLRDEMKKDLVAKGFPRQFVERLTRYWTCHGEYVRNLRDVSEHFMDLSGDALIEWKNDPGQLLIFLPDNPESKSPRNFEYKNENDAFEVISTSLQELNAIVGLAGEIAQIKSAPFQQGFAHGRNGKLSGQSKRTVGLAVSIKSDSRDAAGKRRLVLDAIEFGQHAAGENENAEAWFRQPKTDQELGL